MSSGTSPLLDELRAHARRLLAGRIDEFADFAPFLSAAPPLKLNLAKVTSINSIGVRKFLEFIMKWAPKKFELYDCPADFISNVNVIPQMLGHPSDPSNIKSFYVPYECGQCKALETRLLQPKQVKFGPAGEPILPPTKCTKCSEPLVFDAADADFFAFLEKR